MPYAEPDRVYDIKYYTRDLRRSELNTTVTRRAWKKEEATAAAGVVAAKDPSSTTELFQFVTRGRQEDQDRLL